MQFCVEEALVTKLEATEMREQQHVAREAAVSDAQADVAAQMARLQGRAR